jgi:hypothetical protein
MRLRSLEGSLKSVLDALGADEDDPYWCRRLLEEAIPPSEAAAFRPRLVRALATWASYDPEWFARDGAISGFWYAPLLGNWTTDMFEKVERRVAIRDPSMRHLVLAKIWWTGDAGAARAVRNAEKTARHLLMVDKRHQSPNYGSNLVMVLAGVDPARVIRLKGALVASPQARKIARAWPALLENDLRLKRWRAYDQRRQIYRALQGARVTIARHDRRVFELDGVRKAKGVLEPTPAS